MNLSPLPGLALASALLTASIFAAAPTIEETVLGPTDAGGLFVVGARGHVAFVGKKEAKLVVTVDGVAGPGFDELYTSSGRSYFHPQQAGCIAANLGGSQGGTAPVYFSVDGEHHAYLGRQGADLVVMHDGKEIRRTPKDKLSLNFLNLNITPYGRHVWWVEVEATPARSIAYVTVNGQRGPATGPQPNNWGVVFNREETRWAYSAQTADTNKPLLIVDGKDPGYWGRDIAFTADGKTLLCVNFDAAKPALLANGKPAATGQIVQKIIPAPVGGRWAAIVRTGMENGVATTALFVDGQEVPAGVGASDLLFNADGKHYAASCVNNAARAMFIVHDGEKLREYPQAGTPRWTPDGSKFIYDVAAGGRKFLVVNNEEFPIRDMLVPVGVIVMSETGGHYAYGTRDNMNTKYSVMIDGKNVLPDGHFPYDHSLQLTPDGARHAFFVGKTPVQQIAAIVVDGELQHAGMLPAFFSKWVNADSAAPSLVFSRDGKHLAYWLRGGAEAKARGMYVNGKMVFGERRTIYFPTFTPDSKHLCWLADEPADVRGQPSQTAVYVDGRRALQANGNFFANVRGTWNVDRDGVVTFLAAEGNVAKRYRITAPDDTSVATMLAATP